jgi:hypothetical protein
MYQEPGFINLMKKLDTGDGKAETFIEIANLTFRTSFKMAKMLDVS